MTENVDRTAYIEANTMPAYISSAATSGSRSALNEPSGSYRFFGGRTASSISSSLSTVWSGFLRCSRRFLLIFHWSCGRRQYGGGGIVPSPTSARSVSGRVKMVTIRPTPMKIVRNQKTARLRTTQREQSQLAQSSEAGGRGGRAGV